MTFFLRRPADAEIHAMLAAQAPLPLSYTETGVTRGDHRPRRPRNHHRARLGAGAAAYAAAVAAMRRWAMYDLSWTAIVPATTPTEPGAVFATVVRHLGFWSVNPCRVVYAEETDGPTPTTAFAIGTLPMHAERGEERFSVAWHRDGDDAVWFEILAYAGARHPLARLGGPTVRLLQRRFGRAALRAMRAAVDEGR